MDYNQGAMDQVAQNLQAVLDRIAAACRRVGRDPAEVKLVAVTKTLGPEVMAQAVAAGADRLGENYIQEAARKKPEVPGPARWHFIGHLQRNKAKLAVELFDVIETVDNSALGREVDRRCAAAGREAMDVLVQVNVGGEESKSGVSPEGAADLIRDLTALPRLRLRGLMTMPPWFDDPEKARPYFIRLRRLRDRLQDELPGIDLPELSMGMSGDFEAAIEEGATIVRVGTAIFGPRSA
jgi:pyridoxal phosphate enzyme (YggS family)